MSITTLPSGNKSCTALHSTKNSVRVYAREADEEHRFWNSTSLL